MPKVLNGSSIKILGRIDDADGLDTAENEQNGKDDGSVAELSVGNEQQEFKSNSFAHLHRNGSSKTKNCKRLWTLAQNHGKYEDIAPSMKIDDPIEAANSSVWSTLGTKNEKMRSFVTFCHVFESNSKRSRNMDGGPSMAALMANPAALSRSVKFHESF